MKGKYGFLSPDPCRICGGHKNNQQHPTRGYVVCVDHQVTPWHQVPPLPRCAERDKLKEEIRR